MSAIHQAYDAGVPLVNIQIKHNIPDTSSVSGAGVLHFIRYFLLNLHDAVPIRDNQSALRQPAGCFFMQVVNFPADLLGAG